MKKRILVAISLLALAAVPALAQDLSQAQIKSTHVRGNIYMLQDDYSGNVGVSVGPDGILIVDDKFAPMADKIRAALKEAGGGELKFILNTHWHHDHTDGNKVFGPEAPIIAQTNVRKRLMTDQPGPGRTRPALPPEAWPVITFDDSVSVHFNGEEIKVIHFPHGHTDGDSIIFFTGSNVVHMGDDFFSGRFPFVDLDSGGDVESLTRNVEKVLSELPADVKIIPGHGPLSTLDDLKAYHQMLVETTDYIRKQMAAGKNLEQIQSEGLPEKWAPWSGQFISTQRWIETVYRSLSRQSEN
jgi:cyclase